MVGSLLLQGFVGRVLYVCLRSMAGPLLLQGIVGRVLYVCLGSMAGPLLLQGIVGQVLYVSEAWQAFCCCRALWVEYCMSRKHGGPSVVAGHCRLSAVCLGSMADPLLLQGIVG